MKQLLNGLINHSIYMIDQYGWYILSISVVTGVVATYVLYRLEEKPKQEDKVLDQDGELTWDEYGNPQIK